MHIMVGLRMGYAHTQSCLSHCRQVTDPECELVPDRYPLVMTIIRLGEVSPTTQSTVVQRASEIHVLLASQLSLTFMQVSCGTSRARLETVDAEQLESWRAYIIKARRLLSQLNPDGWDDTPWQCALPIGRVKSVGDHGSHLHPLPEPLIWTPEPLTVFATDSDGRILAEVST